jgi:Tfp pilus assembly protein PilX
MCSTRLGLSSKKEKNERGALAVTSLLLMLALVIIGALSIMITVTERYISRNHKMAKEVFYVADSGHPVAVTVIEDLVNSRETDYRNFSIAGNLKNEVMDYHQETATLNDRILDSPGRSPDIQGTLGNHSLRIDIDRLSTAHLHGGSVEFAAGGEGIGLGSMASTKLLFEISSEGYVQNSAISTIVTTYRKIL